MEIFLNILWFILGFIGILLLLILLIIGTVLFSPIKYSLQGGNQQGNFFAQGKFSWIFSIIKGNFSYTDNNEPILNLTIFGIKMGEKEEKEKKEKKHKKSKNKNRRKNKNKNKEPSSVLVAQERKSKSEEKPSGVKVSGDLGKKQVENSLECSSTNSYVKKSLEQAQKTGYTRVKLADLPLENTENTSEDENQEKESFKSRVETFIDNNSKKYSKIKSKYKEVQKYYKAVKDIKHKKMLIKQVKILLNNLWKHLSPEELNVTGKIGLGDPCTTGQLMGFVSILVSRYGEHIQISGDFTQVNYEDIALDCKGNIVAFPVIYTVGNFILNKDIQGAYKRFKHKIR